VRYSGINAPEKGNGSKPGELFGKEAFEFNRNLVLSKKVRLESDLEEKDRYGRILAYVYLSDNTFVNLRMIETGHAFVLYQKPNIKYFPILLQAQQKAMISEKGIWTALKEDDRIQYVGNRNSKRFHKVSCPLGKKIRPDHHLFFKSKRDAFWEGYSPCRECSPALFVTPS
jgi:endonuclease YncB( thermonuclease family)